MQLAGWQGRFEALGIHVAAMSYDTQSVLAAFHQQHGLEYPLLRDVDARHVQAYGVLNPQYEPGDDNFGIPLPGALFVSPDGVVRAKFAVPGYKDRPEFSDIHDALERLVGSPDDG